jgi:hypothetical protein
MNKHNIKLHSTESVNSVNTNEFVDLELKNTSKIFMIPNVIDEVDSYKVFQNERSNCHKYRLILTINPFCTNVLFNALTEIVKDEGSKNVEVVTDEDGVIAKSTNGCYGLSKPNRREMILNTEYSRTDIGYTYMPGYDIFTNHILRNKTFKLVNALTASTSGSMSNGTDSFCGEFLNHKSTDICKKVFNTIGDFMRYSDGKVVQYRRRENINDSVDNDRNRHLYLYDDLLSMEDSINQNLSEENGWFGFTNNSTISSKIMTNNTHPITKRKIWEDLNISRVLNDRESCEFVDMYPDRSLFSFNPKLNTFRRRLEHNWNVLLTYPYRNDYCHDIITSQDGKTNGLKIMSVIKTSNNNGNSVLLFRSYAKHGLKRGDSVNLYANGKPLSKYVKISNIGNMSSSNDGNERYYFYTTDMSLLMECYDYAINAESGEWEDKDGNTVTTSLINEKIKATDDNVYRIRRIVNGTESEYYIRVFRKLPNLKNKKEKLTDDISRDKDKFEEYLYGKNMNASEMIDGEAYMTDFNKEQYRLAFARTIYNDFSTQLTFTDTIDTEFIVDNLGRPLHEIYATIIKTNNGYKEWYGTDDTNRDTKSDKIEFSHCFGNISSGFEFSNQYSDRLDDEIPNKKAAMGDITMLNELGCFNPLPYEKTVTDKGGCGKDEFFGDIVEFSPSECMEHVLEDINYRFNTAQRELDGNNEIFNKFEYQEIGKDDYDDGDGLEVLNNEVQETVDFGGVPLKTWQRPEGYFYRAHYPIRFMEVGDITQSAHKDIRIKSCHPIQLDGIYLSLTSSLSHGLSTGDIIYFCIDDENDYRNDKWYDFSVSYVIDKLNFVIKPHNKTWQEFRDLLSKEIKTNNNFDWNWIAISSIIPNNTTVKLRRKNIEIPSYAVKISNNKFVWRNLYRIGETADSNEKELVYTNDSFYINKEINFFLKRQDPYGYNGLYCKEAFPNDVIGNMTEEDNYFYKDENDIIC